MNTDTAPLITTLEAVMSDYDGQLANLLREQNNTANILVTWQVDVDVKTTGKQNFFVVVAVCFTEGQDEEVRDIASQLCPSRKTPIFAFIPAYNFGSKEFGIFIAETNLGEILVNGLVNEVIEQAGIEDAVIKTSKKKR